MKGAAPVFLAALAVAALAPAHHAVGAAHAEHYVPPSPPLPSRAGLSGDLVDALEDVNWAVVRNHDSVPRELAEAIDGLNAMVRERSGVPRELADALEGVNAIVGARADIPGELVRALDSLNAVVREHKGSLEGLEMARDAVDAIVAAHADGDYWAPDYPLVGADVDVDNARLVLVMHEMVNLAGIAYDEGDLMDALGAEVEIALEYGAPALARRSPPWAWGEHLVPETRYYLDNCLPLPSPGYRAVCVEYAPYLAGRGADTVAAGVTAPSVTLFAEDFELGLAPGWTQDRGAGWRAGEHGGGSGLPAQPPGRPPGQAPVILTDEMIVKGASPGTDPAAQGPALPERRAPDLVAEVGECEDVCTITLRDTIDISGHSFPQLRFLRYVGSSLIPGEYLSVQVHSGGRWSTEYEWMAGDGGTDRWEWASSDLSHLGDGEIRVRFLASAGGPQGSVAIDDVEVRGVGPLAASLPPRGERPLDRLMPDALGDGGIRRLAGNLAEMYHAAMESDFLSARLPHEVRSSIAPGGASPHPHVVFSEDFESGLAGGWEASGSPGWEAVNDAGSPGFSPSNLVAEARSCDSECAITMRAPVSLSRTSSPHVNFGVYHESLGDGAYLRAEFQAEGEWFTMSDWDANAPASREYSLPSGATWALAGDGGANLEITEGAWWGTTNGLPHAITGEIKLRFVTGSHGPLTRVAIDELVIRGIEGTLHDDYAPTRGTLTPERMGDFELRRLAGDLASLHRIAEQSGALRSHLPQDVQEAIGLGPFAYEYANCYLRSCPEASTAEGWDHESYLRSEFMDLTGLCRLKHVALTSGIAWVDDGAYWNEFLHLCGKWREADRVVEAFVRHLGDGTGACAPLVERGWRLGESGLLYDPARGDGSRRDPLSATCASLPGTGALLGWEQTGLLSLWPGHPLDRLGEFLLDWRRVPQGDPF